MAAAEVTREPSKLETILLGFGDKERELISKIQSQMNVPRDEQNRFINLKDLGGIPSPVKTFLVELYNNDDLKKIVLSLIQKSSTPPPPPTVESGSKAPEEIETSSSSGSEETGSETPSYPKSLFDSSEETETSSSSGLEETGSETPSDKDVPRIIRAGRPSITRSEGSTEDTGAEVQAPRRRASMARKTRRRSNYKKRKMTKRRSRK